MATPTMNATEERLHDTFTALMWGLSYPGRPQTLPAGGSAALPSIAETLVDLETTYFTPDNQLARAIALTGGRAATLPQARYHFYPKLHPAGAELLADASTGTYSYPDNSATIVIGCASVGGPPLNGQAPTRLRLSGPGISGSTDLQVEGVPANLWTVREGAIRYPLGWDLFLVANDLVVGLPRTTVVEVLP